VPPVPPGRWRRRGDGEAGRKEAEAGHHDDGPRAGELDHERTGHASDREAAFRVKVKRLLAARSSCRGTSDGIIAASAGAKNTVIVETTMFRA
jgi:hypothetical protein